MKKYDLFWEGTVKDHIVSGGLLSCTHHLLNQKRQIKDAHLTFWVQDGTLQCSLVSVSVQLPKVSPSSYPNDLSAQIKSPPCTICWVITHGPGRPCLICNKLSQVGKEEKRLFPWHNLINTMHHSSGKPAVMWEGALWQLSPDNYCLFGGLKWHGREKENFKISSNFIAYNVFCQHMLWQSKKSISPASFFG